MEENKKAAANSPENTERAAVPPKRKYRYIGPAFKKGIFLPDAVTLINPNTVSDSDLETYFKRFPTLRGLFEEVK